MFLAAGSKQKAKFVVKEVLTAGKVCLQCDGDAANGRRCAVNNLCVSGRKALNTFQGGFFFFSKMLFAKILYC